jgi:sugar/nucleoside kinase (ribokinase family)
MRLFDVIVLDRATFAGIAATDAVLRASPERLFERHPDAICQAIILTQGADGAVLLRPGKAPFRHPAPEARVVDATGAGDALTGVFLGSWLSQGDPEQALVHAVRGASLAVTALGAQGLCPSAEDLGVVAHAVPAEV